MHPSAVLLAIALSAVGCAHLNPSEAAYEAQREAAEEAAAASHAHTEHPDAWWYREIAHREARIRALHEQVRQEDVRQDDEEQERLEREAESERESLEEFRETSMRSHSRGMVGGGVVLIVVGSGALFATLMVTVYAALPSEVTREDAATASVALLPLGASALAVGLPLFVIGKKQVIEPEPTARLLVGPGDLAIRGSF